MDEIGGSVLIRKGKGDKPRLVFLDVVWITSTSDRLAISSLQGMLDRRASGRHRFTVTAWSDFLDTSELD